MSSPRSTVRSALGRAARRAARPAVLALAALATGCSGAPRSSGHWLAVEPDLAVHLNDTGDGAPGLVLLGKSHLAADLGPLADDRRVYAYDLRGRGMSQRVEDLRRVSIDADVADLEAVRRWAGLERMVLLGWAYGANVAALYAARHPERVERLVLVAPVPLAREPHWRAFEERLRARLGDDGRAELDRLVASPLRDEDPRAFCEAFLAATLPAYVVDPDVLEDRRAEPCVPPNLDPLAAAEVDARALATLWQVDWPAELARVRAPVLLLHGTEDPFPAAASQAWLDLVPDAELVLLPDVGHLPWLEAPDRFLSLVRAFLAGEDPLGALFP